jgi:hypothetical protein
MRRRLVAAALVVLPLASAGIAAALDGDPPSNVGWWSSEPGASAQPEGGFMVSAIGGSATSVAAVRFSTPSGVVSANLSLQEASGGFVTPATALEVCVTTDPWQPANPGAMADAPKPDCTNKIDLTRDQASLVWSADVSSLMPTLGGEPSLMIVPGETPGGGSPLDPGFRIVFSEAKLALVSAPGTTSPSPPASGGTPTDFSDPGSSASYDPGSAGGSISGIGAVTPTTAAPAATSTTIKQAEAFSPPQLAKGASPGGGGADQPWWRLLFLVPISALIGVGTVFARRVLQQRGVVEA